MNVTNDQAMVLLNKGLDAMSVRQATTSNNIANIETPNYKAVAVAFEAELSSALTQNSSSTGLRQTDANHLNAQGNAQHRLEDTTHRLFRRNNTAMRKDGNNVDIESEMVQMAETSMRYQAMTTLASRKLAILRMIAQTVR